MNIDRSDGSGSVVDDKWEGRQTENSREKVIIVHRRQSTCFKDDDNEYLNKVVPCSVYRTMH